jgi:hypothetical protein
MGIDATIVGSAGVALLLLAFFANLLRYLRADGALYLSLNLVGAALACFSSYLIDFMPFVLLEGTWSAVAAAALARNLLAVRRPAP